MIYIDRTRIPPPPELLKASELEAQQAKEFFADPNVARYGKPFDFKAYRSRGVSQSLLELFYDKCAFCESKLGVNSSLDIDQFRPKVVAVNHDGGITKPGYWWLGWEWSNLYPVCPMCSRTKANRFQVVGKRADFAEVGTVEHVLSASQGPLRSIAMSTGGETIITAAEDGNLQFWDTESGRSHLSTPISDGMPTHIAATPDGRTVVVATDRAQLILCRLARRFVIDEIRQLGQADEPVQDVAISTDGNLAVAASGTNIAVWDVNLGKQIHLLVGHPDRVNAVTLSPDSRKAISVGEEGTLGIWDLETGDELHTLVGEVVLVGLGITTDGEKATSLSGKGTVQVWNLESGEELFSVAGLGYVRKLALSADGKFAVCLGGNSASIVDLYKRQHVATISNEGIPINDISVTPDGRYGLTAGQDGKLKLWTLDTTGAERALLIDPCQTDPSNYLVFSDDGYVASLPPRSDSLLELDGSRFEFMDRGQITIDTFGLNRVALVEERRVAAQQLRNEVQTVMSNIDPNDPNAEREKLALLDDLMSDRHPYAAMRRQLLPKFVEEFRRETDIFETTDYSVNVKQKIDKYSVGNDIYQSAFENLESIISQRREADIEKEDEGDLISRSALISRVEIRNFRCIEDLSFDFSGGAENHVSWKVLLGENGVGKSSILQAVALAVMGKKRLEAVAAMAEEASFEEEPNKTIPDVNLKTLLKRGADKGSVKVYFSTDTEPIELRLTQEGPDLDRVEPTLRTYLLGFGSARWLPRVGSTPPELDSFVRVRNLFNPFVPLTDAIKWLVDLKRSKQIKKYQAVEKVLARLLQLPLETRFPLRKNTRTGEDVIYVQKPEDSSVVGSDRLDQLSDGYQTVLAMAVAIMDMLGERWKMEMEVAEGLVLLDEVGAHLHPRWKLRIVESLRTAFPRMQFLTATHEPLCLRGLYDNEILVLRKDDDQLIIRDNIASPDTLSVDQLLRSPLFGLLTTFDPDTEQDFNRYYEILSKPENARKDDQAELELLRNRLSEHGVLGEMTRRQIASSVMDMKLQQLPQEETFDPQTLTDDTKNEIAGLWEEIHNEQGGVQ